tara:strand:+ start:2848 stop:3930 length:1083 start_codon:yes stop_codon:yes gene_type:complete
LLLLIVDQYSQRGRVGRYPVTLISFAVCVVLVLALSAWFVASQRAVPNRLPARVANQPILSNVDALVVAPDALRPVSTEQAEALNDAIPVSTAPNPAASRVYVPLGDGTSWVRSLDCMTAAIYYEAASESVDGQRAVAQVVLNRMRHPAFPHTVCGVVFQGSERRTGCQFSFTCDGSLARVPSSSGWARARAVADAALAGYVYAPVGWATHYHTNYVAPYWAPTLAKAAIVGAHIFYRWPGGAGRPSAFSSRYAGIEPLIDRVGGALAASRLPGLPAFVGMGDPNAPMQTQTAIPMERSVLPFAAGRKDAPAKTEASGSATPSQPIAVAQRWVIGQRPGAGTSSPSDSAPPVASVKGSQD